jgi:hypothetical protein
MCVTTRKAHTNRDHQPAPAVLCVGLHLVAANGGASPYVNA